MKYLALISVGFCLCIMRADGLYAQSAKKVPVNELLPVITVQNDCPLKIEEFVVVLGTDNRYVSVYRVKNTSRKTITSYRIARMFDLGTGFMEHGPMPTNKLLVGGQSIGTFDQLGKLKEPVVYRGKMKAIAFAMVVSVTFEDGSSYSAEGLYEAFKERLSEYRVE